MAHVKVAAQGLSLAAHSVRRVTPVASSWSFPTRSLLCAAISSFASFMSTSASTVAFPRPSSPSFEKRQAKIARRSSNSIVPTPATQATRVMTVEQRFSTASCTTLPPLLIKLDPEHPGAKAPTRGSALAAGYDLYCSQAAVIPKGGRKVVQTGVRMAVPVGCYGRVAPRSGLASKHGIDVGAGVIDADYRGLVGVLLFNLGDEDYSVNVGDRIAQLVLERIETPEVVTVDDLDETLRGAGGFGSTGGFGPKEVTTDKAE